jgi:hypothetical protein
MRQPILFRRDDTISHDAAMYWKDLLYRTVKIGTELEFALPKGVRKDDFFPGLVDVLKPSQDLNNLGEYGVFDVITEHCGIETQIIGRQPYYPALMRQYHAILDPLIEKGVRVRPTCGLHYHTLTIGLSEPLHDSKVVPEHQNFLNLEHIQFTESGAVKDFHLEFRFPDADIAPTSIVAKTFLFLAMLLKAVEMSQYGVIHVGRIEAWRRKIQILNLLSNNDGNLATSDTSKITSGIIEELRVGSRELLELLKPIFGRFARASFEAQEDHPAFEVLSLLAETPISLLRCSGRDWPEIEALLSERATVRSDEWDQNDRRLIRVIELAEMTGHSQPESWKWETARELFLTPQELERRLERLDQWRGLKWDIDLGTMVFLG